MTEEQTDKETCPLCAATVAGRPGAFALRCGACGFAFALPYCSQFTDKCLACANKCVKEDTAAPAYYAARSAGLRLKVEERRLRRITGLAGSLKGKNTLEIGAGAGALGSLLINSGADYSGLEPSKLLYGESLRSFPDAAARISNGFLPEDWPGAQRFAFIAAIDVLEYIAGPAAFLKRAALALEPGGLIYLEVPDESFFRARTAARKLLKLYSGPVHPGENAGLRVKEAGKFSLLGDPARLAATLKRPLPLWLKAASLAARLTRLDLALGQGNLFMLLTGPE
jgi:SAM-dependent methyltransferase